ncbi:biosynthetic-type acetolactate synthase large subunit [Aminithiophilus ramosus]|uniref:Acetolactate synthase n=2 Tax=Synergistales TaxID=649776 RepID=A0A9Q7EXD6_9BACT|nr:biosynthetic-type acetolactate synthase large subunit [Aminithiophilus ramosus]QTX32395.1 biosynthetic-type acetolactate synthase large subunit [Aminithiophilus ramosus]QVL36272.1 biosynthetic-type acetolactate synthase large subunit [Synergistota bacterium]
MMNGAQMVMEALAREGVDVLFGIPGGTVIPLFDALMKAPFRQVLTRHEQAAVHAAEGYARLSGKVGVCLVTSGPGATNTLTGLADAHMDSVPVVVITGQVKTSLIGTDAFQEADIFGCSMPLVKHSFFVQSLDQLPKALAGAFYIARTGRPGPVLVDIPVDIQNGTGDFVYPPELDFPGYSAETAQDLSQLERARRLLEGARRPLLLAGGGVILSGADGELRDLAEAGSLPVATTFMGKGAFPEDHRLSLGTAGMHGRPAANLALCEADVVVAVGTRFSDRTTGRLDGFAPKAKVIQIDLDRAEVGKNLLPAAGLVGDAAAVLPLLKDASAGRDRSDWLRSIDEWKAAYPLEPSEPSLSVPSVIRAVRSLVDDDVALVTEVGQHQMWAGLHWETRRPRGFISSGGLGTMGFGLPAALGAALASGKPVVCLAGDGSLLMNVQELETCSRYSLPVKVIVFNNGSLGMVRQWQELFYDERYAQTMEAPRCDFVALAEAFSIPGFRIVEAAAMEATLRKALESPGPALVECLIPWRDKVFPMVPAGAALGSFMWPGEGEV